MVFDSAIIAGQGSRNILTFLCNNFPIFRLGLDNLPRMSIPGYLRLGFFFQGKKPVDTNLQYRIT